MEIGQVKPAIGDFEYTIHDKNGIVGVKDGNKFPISQEDWRKAHPLHRDSGCKECTFIDSKNRVPLSGFALRLRTSGYMTMSFARILVVTILVLISLGTLFSGSILRGILGLLMSGGLHLLLRSLAKREDSIKKLGRYSLPDWAGHATWYGFICQKCGEESRDYVHGYAYLICEHCKERTYVKGRRFYKNDGRPYKSLLARIQGAYCSYQRLRTFKKALKP